MQGQFFGSPRLVHLYVSVVGPSVISLQEKKCHLMPTLWIRAFDKVFRSPSCVLHVWSQYPARPRQVCQHPIISHRHHTVWLVFSSILIKISLLFRCSLEQILGIYWGEKSEKSACGRGILKYGAMIIIVWLRNPVRNMHWDPTTVTFRNVKNDCMCNMKNGVFFVWLAACPPNNSWKKSTQFHQIHTECVSWQRKEP